MTARSALGSFRTTILAAAVAGPLALATPSAQEASALRGAPERGMPATVTGVLTILYADDFVGARSELIHMIRDERSGQSFRLRFEVPPAHLRTGMRATARGRLRESELYVAAADGSGLTITTFDAVPQSATVSGDQKTLVIVANFLDRSVDCTVDAIGATMFTDASGRSVDALYREASRGCVSFSGTVTGPYTINATSSDACNISAWAAAADLQASAAGVDLEAYSRKVYVMPGNTCPGAGFGTVGGTPSTAWVFDCTLKGIYAHELGHNLGMDHASTATQEYGDTTDPMAFSSTQLRGLNAPHRQQLGWLPAMTIDRSGEYDVAALALDPSVTTAPQILTIRKPDTNEYYYLSYRTAAGFDSYIDSSYYERVSVHRYKGDGGASRTYLLAGLSDAASFSDAVNGVTITQVSHGASRATVRVNFADPCRRYPAVLNLSPAAQSGAAGESAVYTVSVTNRDSPDCAASTFGLGAATPSGWSANVTPASVTLAPGATATATLTVTASSAALPDTYQILVNAADSAIPAHNTSAAASHTIASSCAPGQLALNVTPANQEGAAGTSLVYNVSVTNTDGSSCTPATFSLNASVPSGWSVSPAASVTLVAGQTGSVLVTVASSSSSAAGTFTWTLAASDPQVATHSGAITATYTVSSPPPEVDPAPQPTDTAPPSTPGALSATPSQKLKQIQLSWAAATDNVGVTGYRVIRNGVEVALTAGTKWADTTWVGGATYTYAVVAFDAAGNLSAVSTSAKVTVPGTGKKR